MPVDWKKYSKNWKEVARQKKESVGWRCEECGKQCRKPGEEFDTHSRTLTVHHIDMDPMNNDPENLIALCAGCHLKRHRKVKSLDKVIELAEHCLKPMGQNLCSNCPGRSASRCNVWEDSLHYLTEYKNKKRQLEIEIAENKRAFEQLGVEKERYQEAVKNCEEAENKYRMTNDALDAQRLQMMWVDKHFAFEEPNDPLTWDELKGMEGRPIWLERPEWKEWLLVSEIDNDKCEMYLRDKWGNGVIVNGRNVGYWRAYRKERTE